MVAGIAARVVSLQICTASPADSIRPLPSLSVSRQTVCTSLPVDSCTQIETPSVSQLNATGAANVLCRI